MLQAIHTLARNTWHVPALVRLKMGDVLVMRVHPSRDRSQKPSKNTAFVPGNCMLDHGLQVISQHANLKKNWGKLACERKT